MPAAVLDLADCAQAPLQRIGGKAVGLGRLLALDLDVPPGFVVATEVFGEWLTANGLRDQIRRRLSQAGDAPSTRAVSLEIAELFASRTLESEAVDAAYARLPGDAEPAVAVRSSATGEDAQESSYAGQQETFLGVRGAAEVRRRIVDCWASLFSAEAIEYRRNLGLAPDQGEMAVVVQAMVPAVAAGVMFTIDPLTGDPSQITIEGTLGLGLPLVGGEVTPDRYCIDKVTLELRLRVIARKPFADRLDEQLRATERVQLSAEEGTASSLTDAEAIALAEIGRRLERAVGSAMDVEWALGPRGGEPRHIYLLQARPETGSAARAKVTPAPRLTTAARISGLRRSSMTRQGD
jgi:phosphoenolpyruvate synthase/pyruvate phosphate dikinase